MSLPPSAHARWLTRHFGEGTTNSAVARCATVDLDNLRKACRGVPKQFSAERMAAVLRVHGLTAEQWAWNVRVGWHWKKSFPPRKGARGAFDENRHDNEQAEPIAVQWCRVDLCRLAGKCPAARVGDFSGRCERLCLREVGRGKRETGKAERGTGRRIGGGAAAVGTRADGGSVRRRKNGCPLNTRNDAKRETEKRG